MDDVSDDVRGYDSEESPHGHANGAATISLGDGPEQDLAIWCGRIATSAGSASLGTFKQSCSYMAAKYPGSFRRKACETLRDCIERHGKHDPAAVESIWLQAFPDLVPEDDEDDLDDVTLDKDLDAEIKRFAKLSVGRRERERHATAERLNLRTTVFDKLVKDELKNTEDPGGQGRPFQLTAIEPWPDSVHGGEVLDEVVRTICRYMVLPEGALETAALWAMHTHCFDHFAHSPRLAVVSPEKGCGKTTLLDVMAKLVAKPLSTSNATTAAIFRVVEVAHPSLLIDEGDTFLKENEELRGILNSGHSRGGGVLRTVGDDHEPRMFSTWAPCAIAMIGRLPDTLEDRSVICSLKRRKPSEQVESFRGDRAEHVTALARKMARWSADHAHQLRVADPDMGDLQNRTADNWRPLFAIADLAGNAWPARAREIATAAAGARTEQSIRAQLLRDIKAAFEEKATDRLSSEDLTEYLVGLDGRPWAEWRGGKPLTKASLARQLGHFGISTDQIRWSGSFTSKGYHLGRFDDAFARYL